MSRSRRKTPIFGITTATSEAEDNNFHVGLRYTVADSCAGIACNDMGKPAPITSTCLRTSA